jgi:hypothetical protein
MRAGRCDCSGDVRGTHVRVRDLAVAPPLDGDEPVRRIGTRETIVRGATRLRTRVPDELRERRLDHRSAFGPRGDAATTLTTFASA